MDVDDNRGGNGVLLNGEAIEMVHSEGLGNLEEGAYVANNGLTLGVADIHALGEEVEMGVARQMHTCLNMMNDDLFLIMLGETGRDFSYVIDTEYTVQVGIVNKVDSYGQRTKKEDGIRGYNQRFAINTGLPVFFNENVGHGGRAKGIGSHGGKFDNEETIPTGNIEPEVAGNAEDVIQEANIEEDQEPIIQEADINMILNQVDNLEEEEHSEDWPTEEWAPNLESNTTNSSTDPVQGMVLGNASVGNLFKDKMTVETISDDHWDILTCRVLKYYKVEGVRASDTVVDNKVSLSGDPLEIAFKMPGVKEMRFKSGIGMAGKGACKKKADSDSKLELADCGIKSSKVRMVRSWTEGKRRRGSPKAGQEWTPTGEAVAKVEDNFCAN